jgi:thioredoxin 1
MVSAVPAVTDTDFDSQVLSADLPVLVEFWAEWCAPCRMIAPVVEDLATELNGRVKFVKMDIDANPDVRSRFAVMSVPTLIVFKDGQAADRVVGYRSSMKLDLRERLEALV